MPATAPEADQGRAPVEFLLRLGDNALVLSHRLSEWTGHGPALEEDIALGNIALDLLGQARMLYSHAGQAMQPMRDEDWFAYWRDAGAFLNFTALELPNSGVHAARGAAGDFGFTIVRQALFSAYMMVLWPMLTESEDDMLAGIAMKAIKETRYHWRHASEWMIRLGDGTEYSNQRVQAALDSFFPYTNEWFCFDSVDCTVLWPGAGRRTEDLMAHTRENWLALLEPLWVEAKLSKPQAGQLQTTGRFGLHGEHLSVLLGDMQSVARAHPGATW